MRCINCGWDNQTDLDSCIKCGQPLKNFDTATGDNPAVSERRNGPAIPKLTVIGAAAMNDNRKTTLFQNSPDDTPQSMEQISSECPSCGYPASANYTTCPACGYEMHRFTVRRRKKESINSIKNDNPKSIDKAARCFLSLLPENDESISIVKSEYKGEIIVLNRDNTEPDNHTITSKEQAELTFENGRWYITNKSTLENTYIQVKGKQELHQDDVILLGDRRFKFEQE